MKGKYTIFSFALLMGIFFIGNSFSYNPHFGSFIQSTGYFPTGDPIFNTSFYGIPFSELFARRCDLSWIDPQYGACCEYRGYIQDQNGYNWNSYVWGWAFDSVLSASDQEGYNILNGDPRNIAQVRWTIFRHKEWRPDGSVAYELHSDNWVVDGGIKYPDQMAYIDNQYIPDPPSRLSYRNWHFRLYDHPGIIDASYHYHISGNYVEVGLFYAQFEHTYHDTNGEVAPNRGYTIKVLLRQPKRIAFWMITSNWCGKRLVNPYPIGKIPQLVWNFLIKLTCRNIGG